ncbi:MAG: hypothetical protein NC311_10740 [Muribaculaceae bacterium]|nr:hypothetical protein [Muribaculaceae bacterium]MCM1511420.1 hypothetical protein [Clostridium sp.]
MPGRIKKYKRNEELFYQSLFDARSVSDMYLELLTGIALSCFEYDNMPDSMDARFLEWCLFYDGMSVIFKDEVMGMVNMQTMQGGELNVYRYPTKNRAWAVNGYQQNLTLADSVIIYNNMTRTNSVNRIVQYARRLANIDLTIQINVNVQKTPYIIKAEEREKFSVLQMFQKLAANEPAIYETDMFNEKALDVLNLDAPFLADKLYRLKTDLWNEALTYLGVSSMQVQKKERVSQSEIQSALGGAYSCRQSRLSAREQALAKVNQMFGTDIKVRFNEGALMPMEGGDGDGGIYDGTSNGA